MAVPAGRLLFIEGNLGDKLHSIQSPDRNDKGGRTFFFLGNYHLKRLFLMRLFGFQALRSGSKAAGARNFRGARSGFSASLKSSQGAQKPAGRFNR